MSLSPSLRAALGSDGVQVEMGPFLVHVCSELPGVADYLDRFYDEFPILEIEGGHFDIAIRAGRGLRRWLRPQAYFVANGVAPFLPIAASLAGASMEWGLNWCIGQSAHRWVIVHAAAVERNGIAVILPAPPGSGKTTLCAAMAFSGWRLLSDEFTLLDPDTCRIHPIPRPVSLKAASIELLQRRFSELALGPEGVDVEGVRFAHARSPIDSIRRLKETAQPGWVILPRFAAGAATQFQRLTKARAMMELTGQSFNYNYLGAKGYGCLAALIQCTDCYTLEYSDLDDVLGLLDRVTAAGPEHAEARN